MARVVWGFFRGVLLQTFAAEFYTRTLPLDVRSFYADLGVSPAEFAGLFFSSFCCEVFYTVTGTYLLAL